MRNSAPAISLVVPCYKVAEYLPDFLDSLDRQEGGVSDSELIFVIDGCPENSADVVRSWRNARGYPMRVIEKPNGGLSSARNAGIRAASGSWVSFPDPDDVLAPNYLRSVASKVTSAEPELALCAARLVTYSGDTSNRGARHPLDYRFSNTDRTVRLSDDPESIHLMAASSFIRLDVLQANDLVFDERLQTTFEDAHLIARYLQTFTDPRLCFLSSAVYYYNKRLDGSSLTQLGKSNYARYVDICTFAYLDLLETDGNPRWLENLVLYDLYWLFRAGVDTHSSIANLTDEENSILLNLTQEVLSRVSGEAIDRFSIVYVHRDIRAAWRSLHGGNIPRRQIRWLGLDMTGERRKLSYYSASRSVTEQVLIDEKILDHYEAKTRGVWFFGQWIASERILRVPDGDAVRLLSRTPENEAFDHGGVPFPDRVLNDKRGYRSANARYPEIGASQRPASFAGRALRVLTNWGHMKHLVRWRKMIALDNLVRRVYRLPVLSDRFTHAWSLMDRDTAAGDNAEALYRYLQHHRPDINAWFVINRDSPDWERLKRQGFKLVARQSRTHLVLMEHTDQWISAHLDHYVVRPFRMARMQCEPWRFTFLQHGVLQGDMSRWFNFKPISMLMTTTLPEYRSIIEDGSPYAIMRSSVALSGQPRHDRLMQLRDGLDAKDRNVLLIMPTWRNYLTRRAAYGNERILVDDFETTDYAQNWRSFLQSDQIRDVIASKRFRVVFAPHPNFDGLLPASWVPGGMEVASYSSLDTDIQELLARSVLSVTDYSSNATESAFVGTPVVYFQFDRNQFLSGEHVSRQWHFDFERDGFGPVHTDLKGAADAVRSILLDGEGLTEQQRRNISDTFITRDGRCCERVVAAIEAGTTLHGAGMAYPSA